ncbi:MAG: flavodoxin family protein [Desulfobulbaceae bacterium]|nr:flavodoxin family protein [Desulfobulbaceae bacterium]HIJ79985.1 flavodoxin family protein [Deltaproteobacteria bacterium]
MKVLALSGSPRKHGNTDELLRAVVAGMRTAGAEVEVIRLCELKIAPCTGCGYCEKSGECVVDDDMTALYQKIIDTDRLVLASPIYFYGLTAQAKAFVDRTQTLWSLRHRATAKGKWLPRPDRKGLLVCVAASHGEKLFDGAILTAKYAFEAMGMAYAGDFLVRGVEGRGEMAKAKEKLEQAIQAGEKFME